MKCTVCGGPVIGDNFICEICRIDESDVREPESIQGTKNELNLKNQLTGTHVFYIMNYSVPLLQKARKN